MGLFDFLKKKSRDGSCLPNDDLLPAEKALLSQISMINARGGNITPELYQQLRDFEMNWLERHYDFNSAEGINAIPVKRDLPGAPSPNSSIRGHTGEVYYYLRHKAYKHEEAGNLDLALACMRKSVALVKCRSNYSVDDCYPLVKMLARAGYVDEAYSEKAAVDAFTSSVNADLSRQSANRTKTSANTFDTDLIIMDVHGSVCSECAKYQGRVYSISGNNRLFPKVPDFFFTLGCVHDGCSHTFWPYIHGINDPDLKYTLSVHPLQDPRYGKDIITFSNRPFIDDRTEACKRAAAEAAAKRAAEDEARRRYEDNMIEIEAERGRNQRNYIWLQTNLPDKCPKSFSGFRRMKSQNTKNYQLLKQLAADLGREI